jgi:hypothetical protein
MAKKEDITIVVTIKHGMSMWDAIKMRIAGDGAHVLWNALAKKITDEKEVPPNV